MKILANIYSGLQLMLLLAIVLGIFACEDKQEVVPKTLEYYHAWLTEIVSGELPKTENAVVGYNKGDFRNPLLFDEYRNDYLIDLRAADSILALPDVTIADIIWADEDLSRTGNPFNSEIFISDRRPIHELIVYCDTLRVHTPVGDSVGQAPEDDHLRFGSAINEARGVRSRYSTIERQVTEAVDSLNVELVLFEDAIIKE